MISFENGKTVLCGKYYEVAKYDMSNESIAIAADGKGGLTSYRVVNHPGDMLCSVLSLDLAAQGKRLSPYLPKTVETVGRMQKITIKTEEGDVSITTFLTKDTGGVFFLIDGGDLSLDLCFNCRDAKSDSVQKTPVVEGQNFVLYSSVAGDWVKENDCFYVAANGTIELLFSFGAPSEALASAFADFQGALASCKAEAEGVSVPSSVQTEEERALYLSSYFTALENHKTIGDFSAFVAGINYLDPARTYYRDSYFTVLPLLRSHPELIKQQLLTLAKGIAKDGACPSAVKSDFTAFWGDHYDSPSFFVMEVYDYVAATGDRAILDAVVNGNSIGDKIKRVMSRLQSLTDESGLIYKEGVYNKRDWADEVNRSGYVTFVEALYYRALVAASRLFIGVDDGLSLAYFKQSEAVKVAINSLLYDEQKGYYVNYKNKYFTEDNLSIDTVFAVLFGVADEQRSKSVLGAMERLLETQNNKEQQGGAFGVMCVYPPYSLPRAACHKSSRLFDYHNGANWCYLTAMYAYAKSLFGMDWRTPLLSTFRYMTEHGHFTPVEYFSPCCPTGSALQAWSAAMAFVFDRAGENFFE